MIEGNWKGNKSAFIMRLRDGAPVRDIDRNLRRGRWRREEGRWRETGIIVVQGQ